MSWRPDLPNPPHSLDPYAFRAGELLDADHSVVGHVLVLPAVFWERTSGRLWWRRWGRPTTTADVWIVADDLDGPLDDWLLEASLEKDVQLWDKGQLLVQGSLRPVRWLGVQASAQVTKAVFDADLDELRSQRS